MSTRRDEPSPAILGAIRVSPRIHNQVVRSDILHLGDVYSAWRIAEAQAGEALGSWRDAEPDETGGRYAAYRAALDREESAARDLERLCGPDHDAGRAGAAG
jgi:hypothetical protein